MRDRLKLYFVQLFLLISSVFTEQSQICVKNTKLAMSEQGDLFWQDNLAICLCRQVRWWKHLHFRPMILRKKIYCKSTKNEWKGYHNKIVWFNFVLMHDFLQRLMSDSISCQKTLNNSHNLQNQWHVVSTPCQEMKKYLTRKVGFEGTPQLGPSWKTQPVTYKVNMEWKSELNLWTKTILTCRSEFLMAWISWSRTWATTRRTTTTSRKPQRCSSTICVRIECTCFCKPIKGESKTTKTHSCLLIYKNCAHRGKNFDWYWARRLFAHRLPSVKTTEYSSSSWSSTSRRWWSDWILENKGISSERSCAVSTLVWWKVEEQHGKRRRKQEKISTLYWSIRTRNSLPPSSSRSFRTQSHWSFITGQCRYSRQFPRVHLPHRMCNQFTLHREFRIDTRWTTIEHVQTDGVLHVCGSFEQRTQIRMKFAWMHHVLLGTSRNVEETSKHGVLGRHQICSTERI